MKQTCVSHSSTESEIISLDAGLRMDGILTLDLWDLVIDVLHSSSNQETETQARSGQPVIKQSIREKNELTVKHASFPNTSYIIER